MPYRFDNPVLEDELQTGSMFLFQLSIGSDALDERRRGGRPVDDPGTSQSIRGHRFPNLELLDAKIASSLNKIIQNSNFKKRVNVAEQKGSTR